MVDLDCLLTDFGGCEALLAKRDFQRDAGGDYLLGIDRVARFDRERLAKLVGFAPRGVQPRQLDRRKGILRARIGLQRDGQDAHAALDGRLDQCVVIASRAQQLGQQIRVVG
jgi:hypothetical protein